MTQSCTKSISRQAWQSICDDSGSEYRKQLRWLKMTNHLELSAILCSCLMEPFCLELNKSCLVHKQVRVEEVMIDSQTNYLASQKIQLKLCGCCNSKQILAILLSSFIVLKCLLFTPFMLFFDRTFYFWGTNLPFNHDFFLPNIKGYTIYQRDHVPCPKR